MGIFNFFKKKEKTDQVAENSMPYTTSTTGQECIGPPVQHTVITVYNREIDVSTSEGIHAAQILRQCEIMDESGNIINTSRNLKTVMGRIPIYDKSLYFLTQCSDSDLKALHLKSQDQLKDMYNSWIAKKASVINSAVSRSCKASIEYAKTLKTEKGQFNHMIAFCNESLEIPGLSTESINFLLETRHDMEESLKALSLHKDKQPQEKNAKEYSEIAKNIHTIQTCQKRINTSGNIQVVVKNIRLLLKSLLLLSGYSDAELKESGYEFSNGSPTQWYKKVNECKHQIIAQVPDRKNYRKTHNFQTLPDELDSIQYSFHDCLSNVDNIRGARAKLALCEKAIPLLSDYVLAGLEQDGDLFQVPYVCDLMIEMYLRIGKCEKAKEYALFFHSVNAYIFEPDEYADVLSYINTYQHTSQIALDFIANNPGFLQKNMYKALEGRTDHDCLMHFLRCSEQIKKEKNGNTYELYVDEGFIKPDLGITPDTCNLFVQ